MRAMGGACHGGATTLSCYHADLRPQASPQHTPGESGQMVVELAVLVPVVIVIALTVLNLMQFVCLCATFDRVALDAIVSQGVAPAGMQVEGVATEEVASCIREALASPRCEVSVQASSARQGGAGGEGLTFPVSPLLTRFTCTLRYVPWPSSFVLVGVAYQSPVALVHERELVVDRFRAGVVL